MGTLFDSTQTPYGDTTARLEGGAGRAMAVLVPMLLTPTLLTKDPYSYAPMSGADPLYDKMVTPAAIELVPASMAGLTALRVKLFPAVSTKLG